MNDIETLMGGMNIGGDAAHMSPRQILDMRFGIAQKIAQRAAQQQKLIATRGLDKALLQSAHRKHLFPVRSIPAPAHATLGSIPNEEKRYQERLTIINAIRQRMGAIPMPKKVREERIKKGLPVPDPNVPYVIVEAPDNSQENKEQQQFQSFS